VARHVELVREVVARTVPASYDRDRLDAAAREALAVAVRS
jgi:hypothetical protein